MTEGAGDRRAEMAEGEIRRRSGEEVERGQGDEGDGISAHQGI